jgi:hypothetical protein
MFKIQIDGKGTVWDGMLQTFRIALSKALVMKRNDPEAEVTILEMRLGMEVGYIPDKVISLKLKEFTELGPEVVGENFQKIALDSAPDYLFY